MKAPSITLDHDVYVYESGKFPAAPIANFLFDGFGQGENAVVIASAHHASAIKKELTKLGLVARLPYAVMDMEFVDVIDPTRALLSGNPVESVLGRIIAPAVEHARDNSLNGRVRIYGELGEVILRLHNAELSKEMERQGGKLAADGMTKIWCGYCTDTFPDASHAKHFTHTCLLHRNIFTDIEDRADWRSRVAKGIEQARGS
jgi:hypothetical protein